jgi:hypothetical protein
MAQHWAGPLALVNGARACDGAPRQIRLDKDEHVGNRAGLRRDTQARAKPLKQ